MGWNLSKNGGLTTSQKRDARLHNLSESQYKERLLAKFQEKRGKLPKRILYGLRKDEIVAKNPVMVLGGGPSTKENIELIKKYNIPKIVVEVRANDCFDNGIIPDYIVTLETNKKYVVNTFFNTEKIRENGTKVIGSFITRDALKDYLEDNKCEFERFEFAEQSNVSNVGLFGCIYARDILGADKVILTGFEHMGTEYTEYDYRIWQTDFFRYVQKVWPKEFVVNCSGKSALYYKDFIIETALDRLKIEST